MAILKIARMGYPVLRQRAAPVEDPEDPEVRRLIEDMIETMEDAGGTGLAAPQVHVPLRIVVFYVSGVRARREEAGADGEAGAAPEAGPSGGVPLTVLINPEVAPLGPETTLGWEACLSVPGLAGQVPRYDRVRYRAQSLNGRTVAREAAGFHARVVQHECDHLDGILYPQRMTDLATLSFASELGARAQEEAVEE